MIVEGSGRVADVIAQVAGLPVSKITINLIRQKLSVLFHDTYEQFTEARVVEWTKKVSPLQADLSLSMRFLGTARLPLGAFVLVDPKNSVAPAPAGLGDSMVSCR